ncbi:MAG: hypothetical protein KF684_08715 [Phycisphaeraceae bacterium]|nr:hypothetical protein [Phycisphaeraceae bacterium]
MHPDDPRAIFLEPMQFLCAETVFASYVEQARRTQDILVVSWYDECRLSVELQRAVEFYHGIFHLCERYRSYSSLLLALAASTGIGPLRSGADAERAIVEAASLSGRGLFLAGVEQLQPKHFAALRGFHREVPFMVLTSSSSEPLDWAKDESTGGHFSSRTIFLDLNDQ